MSGSDHVKPASPRTGASFARPIELSREADDVVATDLMPGLELPLARVFRE